MLEDKYILKHNVHCIWDTRKWSEESLLHITSVAREFLNSSDIHCRGYLFQTSGTTDQPKFILHTEDTLTSCAQGCQLWLELTQADRWMNVLSEFHMGGFSTYFRTQVLRLKPVHTTTWDLQALPEQFEEHQCTLISLVPTQIYQIVEAQLHAPKGLRLTLVGGGALDSTLQQKANSLGWNVVRSLGSTETGSQIFTEKRGPTLLGAWALPHFEVRTDSQSVLQVKGAGLFKGYVVQEGQDYRVLPAVLDAEGFWTSADRVLLDGRKIVKFYGRITDQVKILGHLVDVNQVRDKWKEFLREQQCHAEAHLEVLPDIKSENQVVLCVEQFDAGWDELIKQWNQRVASFEGIRGWFYLKQIPRSDIGKVQSYQIKRLFSYDG
ncbi:MAG: AMP-binding protein [Bdellovibrionaceae bacterium]|nr:AMP-binding protein [Pseudobdellovibrionaceae bacterium]